MTKVPSLNFNEIINALRRDGWIIVRQKGSHIRLQKATRDETLKLTVPAHRPIKRSTLSHILKQARISVEQLNELLWNQHSMNGFDLICLNLLIHYDLENEKDNSLKRIELETHPFLEVKKKTAWISLEY